MIPGFWQQLRQDNRDIVKSSTNFGSISKPHFVFPNGNGPRGSFLTMKDCLNHVRSRDVIVIGGVLREQVVAPLDVYDVTIIGAANLPRQATSGGVPTGGGASWLAPINPVANTPLLELRAQGWAVKNIEFTPVNASAAIRLTRSAVVDTIDASHASFEDCYFAANGGTTQIGIEDNGGCSRVAISNSRFEGLTGTAILSLNTAAAIPLGWRIIGNLFLRNTNSIVMSSTQGLIMSNIINQAANDANNKVNLISVSAQGSLNMVLYNVFSDAAANVTIAKGYKPGATDVWRNYVTDVAAYVVTVPA